MTRLLILVLMALLPTMSFAADPAKMPDSDLIRPAGDLTLDEFLWIRRPIVIFADSPADPRFAQQLDLLRDDIAMLIERDVVILTDTDPAANSPLRRKLRPRGFMMVLVDKDGGIKLRKPRPWSVREITRTIDKTDQRMREVEERRAR